MRHGALFNGIGGFQLAAHWMGWQNVFHCEIDKFCNQVVKRHFPESICYEDIKKTDFAPWKGTIDILTGGFPCQPFSTSGIRKGKEDERYLWPEMLRAVGEISPRWIVGENVRGIVSWSGGMVFDEVQADLETKGFEILPFLLPACSVNSPQRRERIYFIARSIEMRLQTFFEGHGNALGAYSKASDQFSYFDAVKWVPRKRDRGEIRNGNGIPDWMDRIGALGNAIVPQIAFEIFKAIEAYEKQLNQGS